MEVLEQLKNQAGAAFDELFTELKAKMAAVHEEAGILDSLRGFAAAVNWKVRHIELGKFHVALSSGPDDSC